MLSVESRLVEGGRDKGLIGLPRGADASGEAKARVEGDKAARGLLEAKKSQGGALDNRRVHPSNIPYLNMPRLEPKPLLPLMAKSRSARVLTNDSRYIAIPTSVVTLVPWPF